jgi:type VI secretion system Hcp family effector
LLLKKGKEQKGFTEMSILFIQNIFMQKNILLALTCSLLFLTGHSQIAMTVEGSKQGKFIAEGLKGKFQGKTELLGYIQEITSPRDVASGMAAGRRSYMPITLLKATGGSSPQFFSAITTNEVLKSVLIEFYRPDPSGNGTEIPAYTVLLENVTVSGYKQFIGPLDNEQFNPGNTILYDEIKLTFQKITVEDKVAKTTAADSTTPGR